MHKFSCKFLDGYLITYFIKGILLRSVFNNKSDSFVDLSKKILETFAFYYFTLSRYCEVKIWSLLIFLC